MGCLISNSTKWCPICSSKVSPKRIIRPNIFLWRCKGCGWEGETAAGQPATLKACEKQINTYEKVNYF